MAALSSAKVVKLGIRLSSAAGVTTNRYGREKRAGQVAETWGSELPSPGAHQPPACCPALLGLFFTRTSQEVKDLPSKTPQRDLWEEHKALLTE